MAGGRVATDHIDNFFLIFVEFSIFFITKFAGKKAVIYNALAGISLGAAILTKWLPALIVLPVWILIVIDSKTFTLKQFVIQVVFSFPLATLVFLPWQMYIFRAFPVQAGAEASSNLEHFTKTLDGQGGTFLYFINKIRINYGELIYLPMLWFLWVTFRGPVQFKRLAVITWVLVPLIFFSFAQTKMQCYVAFVSPALFFMTYNFFYRIKENKMLKKWPGKVILFLLIALPVRYSIERMKPFDKIDRNPAWVGTPEPER